MSWTWLFFLFERWREDDGGDVRFLFKLVLCVILPAQGNICGAVNRED